MVHAAEELIPAVLEYVPAGHETQVVELLAPETPEYAPAGHETHALALLAPVRFEYVPTVQFTHALPDKYAPGAQVTVRHTLSALAPTVLDAFPAAQAMHALAPAVPEYVFTGQFAHTLALLAPATPEYAPAAQLIHTAEVFAPATPEYAPAVQFVHDEFPVTFLNFPATHVVQAPPSGPVYPMLHLHSEIDFDDVENGADVPAGHDVHVGVPPVMYTAEIEKTVFCIQTEFFMG